MKKKTKNILTVVVTCLLVLFCIFCYLKVKNNEIFTIRAVVVEVYDNGLMVMGIKGETGLISVGFTKEGNIGFKQGQEIVIYFNGTVMESYPEQLGGVGKIRIVKEKSDEQIPEDILRYCYSSDKNVSVSIKEFTKSSVTLTIKDSNEIPYIYSDAYVIYKKVRNKDYTGVGHKIGNDTKNSTAGYSGTGVEYIWQELEKISNISSKDTVEVLKDNLMSMPINTIAKKYDWTSIYGELEERRISNCF